MNNHFSIVNLIFIVIVCYLSEVLGDIIVETNSGKVAGLEVPSIIQNEKYYSFLSIPYAQPPIGKLRFKPPVPHAGWNEVYDAKKERKHCAQNFMPRRMVKSYGYCGEEDCLHLNVHTPALPDKDQLKFPVIVFLYNEEFRLSYNTTKRFGPDFFTNEGVIIVTVNYRIGFLGFASFEDELLPGNNGIRDVILALKWIKDNIKRFGGDPFKVTLMGHSGGAVIVDVLLQAPQAKNLFNRAILQSGSSWHSSYIDTTPKKRAIELLEALGHKVNSSESLIDSLSNISAFNITEAEFNMMHPDESKATQRDLVQFGPVVEIEHNDAILTKLPMDNDFKLSIPVMIGFSSREAIYLTEPYLHNPHYLSIVNRNFITLFPRRVNYHFQFNDKKYNEAVAEIKNLYFEDGEVKESKPSEFIDYIGDVGSFYATDYTVRKYSNISSAPIFYYMFNYTGELNFQKIRTISGAQSIDGTWGASLGDELCHLFVCKKWKKTYKTLFEKEDSTEIKVLTKMVKLFSTFAETGNPTPTGSDFIWKPASTENRECLIIDEKLKMESKIYEDKVKFWDEFIEKYEKMAIDGVVKDIKDEL